MGRLVSMVVLLAVLLPLSGCAGIKKTAAAFEYYTLEYDAPIMVEKSAAPPLPVVLRLERFIAAPEYSTDRMVYRDSSHKRSVYYYHKWRAVPADLVTFFLKRDLADSGLFAGVLPPERGSGNTHVLDGIVEEFLEWDGEATWEAVLTVNIVLIDATEADAAKRVLFQQNFTAREQCEARQPAFVAKAMSRAMANVSDQIGKAVYSALEKNRQL